MCCELDVLLARLELAHVDPFGEVAISPRTPAAVCAGRILSGNVVREVMNI